jgi:hypothetical protein
LGQLATVIAAVQPFFTDCRLTAKFLTFYQRQVKLHWPLFGSKDADSFCSSSASSATVLTLRRLSRGGRSAIPSTYFFCSVSGNIRCS